MVQNTVCWWGCHVIWRACILKGPAGSRNLCMFSTIYNFIVSPLPLAYLIDHVLDLCICGVLAQGPHDCGKLLHSSVFIIHFHKLYYLTLVVMVPSWFLSNTVKASLKVASSSEVRDSRIFFLSASLKAVMSLKWRKYYCGEQSTVGERGRWGRGHSGGFINE